MANGDTKTESYLRVAAEGTRADLPTDTCCNTKTQNLILGVANRIMDVEDEVEELKNNPDVVDIVDTYQDLQNYDTSTLTDKDIIRVLNDETHDGDSTYYRYSTDTGDFTYIGESKQYTNFVGTDGQDAGAAGLVPAPAAADANKFLKADGTWDTAGGGGGVTVVQTTGTSTTDVMSQNAVTSMVYADPATMEKIKIGAGTSTSEGTNGVEIGHDAAATGNGSTSIGYASSSSSLSSTAVGRNAKAKGQASTSIGYGSVTNGEGSVAIGDDTLGGNANTSAGATAVGRNATASQKGSVAVGAYSYSNVQGQMDIGTTQTGYGYNSTNYRLLSGLYDGQTAHDAMTVGQANALIDAINTALGSSIPHIGS